MNIDAINLADVKSRKIQWLMEPYIPLGTVTVLLGDGGLGKSFLSLAIAAAVTRGLPVLPGAESGAPAANVILQNAENALPTVVKPRLELLGADCSKVYCINENESRLTLTDERIEAAIEQYNARLVIIDPIQSYAGVSMNNAESIRLVLTRLEQVAERNKCVVFLVGHLNKGRGAAAQYRGLGSVDIFNSVPSVLYLGKSGEDTRVMVHGKSNLDETGPALEFRLSKRDGFEWLGESDMTIEELLAAKPGARGGRLEEAEDFLRSILSEGSMPAADIEAIAANSDISLRTLNRAKKAAGINAIRVGGHWHWSF